MAGNRGSFATKGHRALARRADTGWTFYAPYSTTSPTVGTRSFASAYVDELGRPP